MRHLRFKLAGLVLLFSGRVFADGPTGAPPAGTGTATTPKAEPTEAKKQEARIRYQKALSLFDDGAFDAALIEFKEGYALAPSFRILYNMGVTSERLKDFVGAVRYYEQFLKDGGTDVKEDQRTAVGEQLQLLKGRIAKLTVKTNVPTASILVDDIVVGVGEVTAKEVNSGRRRITVTASGYQSDQRSIDAPGGDTVSIDVTLQSTQVTRTVHEKAYIPWLGIVGTLAFSGAAVASGVVALGSGSTYDDLVGDKTGKVTRDQLDSQASKTKSWSVATDLFIVGAVGFAAFTVYDILRPHKNTQDTPTTPKVGVSYINRGAMVGANFRF